MINLLRLVTDCWWKAEVRLTGLELAVRGVTSVSATLVPLFLNQYRP